MSTAGTDGLFPFRSHNLVALRIIFNAFMNPYVLVSPNSVFASIIVAKDQHKGESS